MKAKTKPFTSEIAASSFSKLVNGKVTTQNVRFSKNVYHVHYKSDGVYKGKNKEMEQDHEIDGYTHNYNDI